MTFAHRPGSRQPTSSETWSLELVSGFLMIIGIAAILIYASQIIVNDDIVRAQQGAEYQGLGLDENSGIRLITPSAEVDNQDRFVVDDVDADSLAATAGLQEDDILTKVGETELNATEIGEDGLENFLSQAFTQAIEDGETSLPIEVYRAGETIPLNLPIPGTDGAFEVTIPVAGDTAPIGLELDFEAADDLSPYYAINPAPDGPAAQAGIPRGAKLLAIDGNEITADMSAEEVVALARDADVELEDEDFSITVDYAFVRADGREVAVDGKSVIKEVPPTLFIAFVDNFGFAIPLLVVFLGLMFVRIGTRLRRMEIGAARWASVIFMWLIVGVIVVAIRNFWLEGKGGSFLNEQAFDIGAAFSALFLPIVVIIPLAIAYWWISSAMGDLFVGEETLTIRNTRFAWTLLVPTLAVLILVAARPLEQTFIKSLTDDIFGTARPARFVGLDNYQKLLTFRPVMVDCRIDEETGECIRARGVKAAIQWERTEYEERSGEDRYREALTVGLPWSDTKGIKIVAKDPQFINGFINTMRFTISSVVFELLLGLIIALVVNSKFSGRGLMRVAMLVPWAIPTVVGATLWQVILRDNSTGIANVLLRDLGLISANKGWLLDTGPWMNSIVAVDVWKTSPFMALLILAGLQTIPSDIYEAASVDGASKIRQFFQITLPLLRPTIAVALIFRTLDALRVFDVFQVMLDPTRPSLATYNYTTMVDGQRQVGYASAIGVLIFIFIFGFTILYVRFVGIEQE